MERDEQPVDDRRMPFTEHLQELRTRLRNSVAAVAISTVACWLFKDTLFEWMERPVALGWNKAPADLPRIITFTNLIDPFMVYFKLALLAGVFLSSPVIFHQIWKFISPGLYAKERRLALPFILTSVALFVGGAAFAYYLVLPQSYGYFLSFSSQSIEAMKGVSSAHGLNVRLQPMLSMDEYFSLTSTLLLMFGAVFELPMILAVLAMIGIVTPGGLWRFNRYAILCFFILGAVLTPGDLVVGQIAMGLSLTVLYNLSILAAIFVRKRRAQPAATAEAESGALTKTG